MERIDLQKEQGQKYVRSSKCPIKQPGKKGPKKQCPLSLEITEVDLLTKTALGTPPKKKG